MTKGRNKRNKRHNFYRYGIKVVDKDSGKKYLKPYHINNKIY